ncbi:MAG: hypothetical protein H7A23_20260 [Leptospiraceae bacterium]|nr:hypothetical protein [Leptospiraceae bacterium]MCP5496893.1 hypothetical protein [Leptospiraceae bacterium]
MKKSIIFLAICFLFFQKQILSQNTLKTPVWGYAVYESLQKHKPEYWEKTIPKLKVLSISGFRLNKRGKLKFRNPAKEVLLIARKHNVKIYPMVTFVSGNEGILFLKKGESRNIAVLEISKFLDKYQYDGIHIDFEYMPVSLLPPFQEFLTSLKAKLNKNNKALSMALFPQIDFPKEWSSFHDVKVLANSVNEFVLMSYDYHGSKSEEPGPITEIAWTQKNVEYILKFISSDRLWLGIPAYGYEWNAQTKKAVVVTEKNGISKMKKYKFQRHKSGCIYYTYKSRKGNTMEGYFSDKETRNQLEIIANKYNLKGIGVWRLGFEIEL